MDIERHRGHGERRAHGDRSPVQVADAKVRGAHPRTQFVIPAYGESDRSALDERIADGVRFHTQARTTAALDRRIERRCTAGGIPLGRVHGNGSGAQNGASDQRDPGSTHNL